MSTILGNPITLGGGGSKVPDYTYTGNAEWYNEEHTILKLKTSGVLKLTKSCIADVFVVGGGGAGNYPPDATSNLEGAGGGGGGYTSTARVNFTKNTEYQAIVGAGGARMTSRGMEAPSGGTTSLNGVSASGGGGGRYSKSLYYSYGGDGGSGGAGGGGGVNHGGNIIPNPDGGTDGANGGSFKTNSTTYGYGGSGQGTTTRAFGEATGQTFAGGGGGAGNRFGVGNRGGTGGGYVGGLGSKSDDENGTDGVENTGGGGGGSRYGGSHSGAGGSGVILIRFA